MKYYCDFEHEQDQIRNYQEKMKEEDLQAEQALKLYYHPLDQEDDQAEDDVMSSDHQSTSAQRKKLLPRRQSTSIIVDIDCSSSESNNSPNTKRGYNRDLDVRKKTPTRKTLQSSM